MPPPCWTIWASRAHVIGLSLGGMIAQELALTHPERVDHLVLYATYARPRAAIHEPWFRNWVEACERGTTPDQLATLLLPWFLTPAFMGQPDQVEAAIAEWVADPYPAPAHGVAAQAAACLSHDTLSRLGQIATPTLVLVGAEDIVTPVSCAQELADGIPRARLHVLERGGHTPDVEYPEAVAEAMLAFLPS